uniref:SGNH hydrolase-type esterase domain-containing protein n=1 Tax=termite gut metagenome TaxID=433724 RepID=S0DDI7_9ZZZZ
MYDASRILEVRSATLQTLYSEGTDYFLRDGKLVIPEGSSLPVTTNREFYPDHVEPGKSFWKKGGGYILFSEGNTLHKRQYVVTYEHQDKWTEPVPEGKLNQLPALMRKLRANTPVKILFYGDSITCGYNSSGVTGIEPFLPGWPDLVIEGMRRTWPAVDFTSVNTAVGGKSSNWGVAEAKARAADHKPDLAVLAFGMNDGTGKVAPDTFRDNISKIMNMIQTQNPVCEFILLSTSVPCKETLLIKDRQRQNGESPTAMDARSFYGTQEALLPALESLTGSGVVLADMTTLHRNILKHKRFRDLSGNNVNHPNDFFARIHAQLLLRTLEEK